MPLLTMTGFFDSLGSPRGGAGTASAVTERAASLVKGRWHGEAVTEGFRPPESYPKNGIPQSASLTAPFHKGAKGRGLRIPTSLRSRWQLCCLTDAAYPLRVLRPSE